MTTRIIDCPHVPARTGETLRQAAELLEHWRRHLDTYTVTGEPGYAVQAAHAAAVVEQLITESACDTRAIRREAVSE
jgi:hypothetical protein